jgi:hypothetical protein
VPVLSVKVPLQVAAAVAREADDYQVTVSGLLRLFVQAIADGRLLMVVDGKDEIQHWLLTEPLLGLPKGSER